MFHNGARRNHRRNNDRNNQRRLAVMVAGEMAAAMRAMPATPPPAAERTTNSTYKHFMSCKPPSYTGQDGATSLLQWIEGMESVFSISELSNELRVKFAATVFTQRALTWWNKEKQTRGMEQAHALAWNDLKALMLAEFCPRNEVKKLEAEFNSLAQEGGNNAEYTVRFHELSLLVPRMVTPPEVAIDKYIDGLPPRIRDMVTSNLPDTLERAMRLAATLTDNRVKDGKLIRTSDKKGKKIKKDDDKQEVKAESSETKEPRKKKRKTEKVYAITAPAPTPPAKQQYQAPQPPVVPPPRPQNPAPQVAQPIRPRLNYTGPYPVCNTCSYHHMVGVPCRYCTKCNKYGHLAPMCKVTFPQLPAPAHVPNNQAPRNGCYTCADPNHFARNCPHRARVFNVNPNQAPANPEVPNV